jgi:hypothetical protein
MLDYVRKVHRALRIQNRIILQVKHPSQVKDSNGESGGTWGHTAQEIYNTTTRMTFPETLEPDRDGYETILHECLHITQVELNEALEQCKQDDLFRDDVADHAYRILHLAIERNVEFLARALFDLIPPDGVIIPADTFVYADPPELSEAGAGENSDQTSKRANATPAP